MTWRNHRGRKRAGPEFPVWPEIRPFVLTLAILFNLASCQGPGGPPPSESEPPAGLVGELRQLWRLDLLPAYRPGSVVAQISSYDTTGGNDDGFSGQYSFLRREEGNLVLADLQGPGVVNRIWTPTPTESLVAFYFDGEETPRLRLPFKDLFSGRMEPFVEPLVGNEIGGFYCYLPIPYARSLKIVYEGDDIRFHQIQYRRYPPGTRVESFHVPLTDPEVLELGLARDRWHRPGARPWREEEAGALEVAEHRFELRPGQATELFRLEGGGRILGLELERDSGPGPWGRNVVLEGTWDGAANPGIRSPVEDFFGYAFGSPSARSLLLGSVGGRDYVYLPMPVLGSAVLSLRASPGLAHPVTGTVRVFYSLLPRDPETEGELFAVWRREAPPPAGEPYLLLDATGRGHHVGTLLLAQGMEPGMTVFFEGDDVAIVDGQMRVHGTGSEDYFNGGWYALLDRWDRGISLPIHGSLDYTLPLARTGGYRFYLSDKVSFQESYRLTIEHGPEGNQVPVDYASVAFYYGDTPPAVEMDPFSNPAPMVSPSAHEFFPQLLSVSVGGGTTVDYSSGRFLEVAAQGDGLARMDLSAVPPGRYRVFLSYGRGPEGAEFSLWRRQVQISPWQDGSADTTELVEQADMGEVELTDQVRTLTLRIRGEGGGRVFRLYRLLLEEQ